MVHSKIKLRKPNSCKRLWLSVMAVIVVVSGLIVSATISVAQANAAQPDEVLVQNGISSMDDNMALQRSISYLDERASDWGIQNANDEFRLRGVFRDQLGKIHVRLDQVHNGVRVFGRQLIVHFNSDGTTRLVTGTYLTGITTSVQPKLTGQEARERALKHFPGSATNIESELMLYPKDGNVLLVYRVALQDDEKPSRIVVFINANTGEKVYSYDDLRTPVPLTQPSAQVQDPTAKPASSVTKSTISPVTGTGNSLYIGTVNITTNQESGSVFSMHDYTRGDIRASDMKKRMLGSGTIFTDSDNIWGDFTNKDPATAGVDAHFGAEMTSDYFNNVHGRNGIKDDGIGPLSRVHFRIRYNNAYWSDSCFCMTYGDGDGRTFSPLVSLDIAGHEMTHGVTSATADLIYDDQSGGLNEAMSDIFGTMVEYYAADHGATTTPDYLIGEDVYTPGIPGDAPRSMSDPTMDGKSIDNFEDYNDDVDVHYSSGIANKAFYLLAEGDNTVTGIGREKAEKIFYNALAFYMIPSETFSQARADTIFVAEDLYGISEANSVGNAWDAVGVY